MNESVPQMLRALRRRILAQAFVRDLLPVALIGSGLMIVVGMINRWASDAMPWNGRSAAVIGIGAAMLLFLRALMRRPNLVEIAQRIDSLGRTRDRLLTALAFSKETPTEMQTLALGECRQFAASRDFRPLVPWELPRNSFVLVVPVVALLMLRWDALIAFTQRAEARAEGEAAVEKTAQTLERLARETEKNSDKIRADELQRLAAELKHSAQELRTEATNKEQAEKAALRRLSELESLVKELEKTPAAVSREEMKELAALLAQNDVTKAAAAALQAGNMEAAAKQLEEAAKDEAAARKFQETLQQALEQLAAKRKLSEQLQQMAERLQQRAGPGSSVNDALQRLAEMLRQMQQTGKGGADKPTQQALNNLLSALQNLKFGESGDRQGNSGAPDGSNQSGEVTVQFFGSHNRNGQEVPGAAQLPTGLPGSEHDSGTTATPFGTKRKSEGEKGADLAVSGALGAGETLSALLPSAGDQSKSARRYRDLYEAMAPAAEEAVLQENIPLGSRFFIKRYFESIRPRE